MLINLLKFLKGYVVVRLTGYSPERFLNLCNYHQITLWGLKSDGLSYEMCMSISSFRKLRPLVHKTRTKVVILKRHGLPFILHRYRSRKLFVLGAAFAVFLLYFMSMFIWNIHIEGNLDLSDESILKYLASEQIVHGMKKSSVHGEEIEADLRANFSGITWTSVEVKGTRLIIHIQENEDAVRESIPRDQPCDLLSSSAGTVVSMIVRNGTPAVNIGDEVAFGDILVKSQVDIYNDAGEVANRYYVHADADVFIQRKDTYRDSFSMHYMKKLYTGKKKTSFYGLFGKHRLEIGVPGDEHEQADGIASEYQMRLTENFYLPVSFGKIVHQEYVRKETVYTKEEAITLAKENLALFFEKLRIKGLQIIENNVKIDINGDICTAFGSYVVEERAVQEQTPLMIPLTQDESEEEREQD